MLLLYVPSDAEKLPTRCHKAVTAVPIDMKRAAILCLSASLGLAGATVELTEKTWSGAIEGKSAFVKFLAPW